MDDNDDDDDSCLFEQVGPVFADDKTWVIINLNITFFNSLLLYIRTYTT